ncbi:TPA: helix-turn-helix transcriptional regulator [Stenotrophomonas maltophilia]
MEYTFTLKHQLAEDDRAADALVERLGEAGCDDALVGIVQPGRLALEFTREAADADETVRSVLADVRAAVPSARLIEVAPDLVGLIDVADIVGVSRQNVRKLMLAYPGSFPAPVHEGSASIWHLAEKCAVDLSPRSNPLGQGGFFVGGHLAWRRRPDGLACAARSTLPLRPSPTRRSVASG